MAQAPLKIGRYGVDAELRIQLERLRAENRRLRVENRELRAALDSHHASARSAAGRGSMEITAGTCVGCDPAKDTAMPELAPDA